MTVLLVLFTFGLCLLIDHFRTRRAVAEPALEIAANPETRPRLQPAVVAGFEVPANLRYHPGHSWALQESPGLVRVGMDDFASKLTGTADHIALPQRGQWIRQGQKLCTVHRSGGAVEMVSPIEGTVADINEAVAQNAEVAFSDPYGEGWLVTVQAPDAKINFRNLLGGALARWWMEEAATRLQRRMPMAIGALAQDGGVAMNNLSTHIADQEWMPLAKEFFLS